MYFNATIYLLNSIILLYLLQILTQLFMIAIRETTKNKRHKLLAWGRDLIGFAEDPEDIGKGSIRLLFVWISSTISVFNCIESNGEPLHMTILYLYSLMISFGFVLLIKWLGLFSIFRIYTEGRGLGINFYYK